MDERALNESDHRGAAMNQVDCKTTPRKSVYPDIFKLHPPENHKQQDRVQNQYWRIVWEGQSPDQFSESPVLKNQGQQDYQNIQQQIPANQAPASQNLPSVAHIPSAYARSSKST